MKYNTINNKYKLIYLETSRKKCTNNSSQNPTKNSWNVSHLKHQQILSISKKIYKKNKKENPLENPRLAFELWFSFSARLLGLGFQLSTNAIIEQLMTAASSSSGHLAIIGTSWHVIEGVMGGWWVVAWWHGIHWVWLCLRDSASACASAMRLVCSCISALHQLCGSHKAAKAKAKETGNFRPL